jgi:hypothetical protein
MAAKDSGAPKGGGAGKDLSPHDTRSAADKQKDATAQQARDGYNATHNADGTPKKQ